MKKKCWERRRLDGIDALREPFGWQRVIHAEFRRGMEASLTEGQSSTGGEVMLLRKERRGQSRPGSGLRGAIPGCASACEERGLVGVVPRWIAFRCYHHRGKYHTDEGQGDYEVMHCEVPRAAFLRRLTRESSVGRREHPIPQNRHGVPKVLLQAEISSMPGWELRGKSGEDGRFCS
jgi:hypothetical protein